MGTVRVAIVGAGNCASSLVQGVEYYKDADPAGRVPGLMHVTFGPYHVSDLEFVAAFDVDAKKVGRDVAEAVAHRDVELAFGHRVDQCGIGVDQHHVLHALLLTSLS